jgi:hypothetical protein
MNNRRWDNRSAFGDQADRPKLQTSSSKEVKCTGERFSWYSCDDIRAKIEPPRCQQYTPGAFLSGIPLNSDEILAHDVDDENWVDHGALSG